MSVHVSELHTDVVPTAADAPARPDPAPLRIVEERWMEARGRLRWLDDRVRAEGFDD